MTRANRHEYERVARESRETAYRLLPELRESEENQDSQYAAVLLLGQLNAQDELRLLADEWYTEKLSVYVYASQGLAMKFAAMKDYDRARVWVGQAVGGQAEESRFLDTIIKFVDANRSETIAELREEARQNLEAKIGSKETQYLAFDVLLLRLLGDPSYMHYYDNDRLDELIMGGVLYQPLQDYFFGKSGTPDGPQRIA